MRINWKLLAGFTLFGAAVSLISGIAGGNRFAVILLRLVLSAVLFGGLGLGVQAILRRFLPELLQTAPPARQSGGESVDIIIDEEVPISRHREAQPTEAGPPAAGAPVEMEGIFPGPSAAPEPAFSTDGSVDEAEGFVDEAEELASEAEELASEAEEVASEAEEVASEAEEVASEAQGFGAELDSDGEFQTMEFPEFAPEAGAGEPPGAARARRADYDEVGDLEGLPEIDSLEGSADSGLAAESRGDQGDELERPAKRIPSTPREMRQAQIEETVKDQDPENLARAVRTFLKKDQ